MDRKNFKGTPQTLIKDARSGDIKKIIHPADTEIGIPELPKDLIVHGTISGSIHHTSDGLSYLVGGTNVEIRSGSNGQLTISAQGASGASSSLSYVTIASEATLSAERVLTGGTGLKISDGGANSNVTLSVHDGTFASLTGSNFTGNTTFSSGLSGSLQRTSAGISYLVGGTNVTIASSSNGQVTISAAAASGAPSTGQYLTLATDPTLLNERVFVPSVGLKVVDGGANGNYTISVDDGAFAALTGSNFTGNVKFQSSVSGSIQKLSSGESYLVGGSNITVSSASNGQITISTTNAAPQNTQYLTLASDSTLTDERVLSASNGIIGEDLGANNNYSLSIDNRVVATLSGSTFHGPIEASAAHGITGSITQIRLIGGTLFPFISAPYGNSITVTTGSFGEIVLSGSGGGGGSGSTLGGGDPGAQYLVLANTASLSNERAFVASTGLKTVDAGANSSYTLSVHDGTFAALTGSVFSGTVSAPALSGSLTRLSSGLSALVGIGGTQIISQSNGQIWISSSAGGSGGGGAAIGASYLQLSADGTNAAERVFTPSTGLVGVDNGSNSTYILSVNDGVVATLSGSTFTGPIVLASNGGITGSLTRLVGGTPFITSPAGNIITITTGSLGQIIISGSGGTPQDLSLYAPLAGATFTGPITAVNAGGITGSITRLVGGTPFITAPAGNVITVTTGSNGQIILSGSGGSSSSAIPGGDPGAQYLVLATTASLSAERTLVPSTGLFSTDAGANGNFTIGVNDRFFAALTGSIFSGTVTAPALSGSHTRLTDGTSFITGLGGITVTSASNGQITISGSLGNQNTYAPPNAQYITLATDSTLTSERVFVPSVGLKAVDAGANGNYTLSVHDGTFAALTGSNFSGPVLATGGLSGSLQKLVDGTSYLVGIGGVTITSQSNGQIFISASSGGSGGGGASIGASYLQLSSDATNNSERVFTPSIGLFSVDGGANSTYTLGVNDRIFAALTGSVFTGVLSASAGISGSIQQVGPNLSYLVAQGGITITSSSNGQITISGSVGNTNTYAPPAASYITIGSDATLTNERSLTAGTGIILVDAGANSTATLSIRDSIVATISGSTFTGPVVGASNGGFTGSLTRLAGGTPFVTVPAGNMISIMTGSLGQIILSGTGDGASSGAPANAQYLTLATDATLAAERVLVPSTGLFATDGGANGNYTFGVNDRFFAGVSGSTFTGPVIGASNGGFTGSLTRLVGGTPFVTVPAGNVVTVSTGSLGQIIISGSGGALQDLSPYALLAGATFVGAVTAVNNGGITGSITRLVGGAPFITADAGNVITVRTGSNGQIIFSGSGGSGGSGAPTVAQYLTLATDATLTAERVLVPSTGLFSTDGGANGNFTIGVNDRFFAALTGSTFSGPIVASSTSGITGSITQLVSGAPFVTAVPNNIITISTGSGGQIILSGNAGSNIGAPASAQFLTLATDSLLTVERVFTPGVGLKSVDAGAGSTYTVNANDSVLATISGSTFTGPVVGASNGGFTGSLTRLAGGLPFITVPAGNIISITTGSLGQIILSGSGDGTGGSSSGGGGDPGAQYLVLAATASLPNERVFTPGTGISAVDAGAGSTYTLGVNDRFFAALTGSVFTGILSASGGISGSIQRLGNGLSYLVGAGNTTVTSQSNGQIIISSSAGTGAPGGNSGTIQINASGSFSGSNQFYYDLFNNRAATGPAGLEIGNPAGTFGTVIQSSATTADRIATIPLTTTSDTFVMLGLSQVLTSKTLTSPTINTPVFGSNAIVSTGEGRFGRIFTSGAVQIGAVSSGTPNLIATEQVLWVSGSSNLASGATRRVAVFGGDVISSGSFQAPWISGSIQKTNAGLSYLVGVGGTSIISQSNGQIWISSSVGGGGAGTTPTGTGFRHVTLGTEDVATKLVENADVAVAAAIAGTKIDPDFGSQTVQTANNMICGNILATSYYETAGSGQATTGNIRLANTNKMVFRNAADTLDACGLEYNVGDVLFFGMTSGYTDQAYGIITGASEYMYLSIASAFYIHLEASEVRMTHPVVGDDSPYACHGSVISGYTNVDYTVPASEYKYFTIEFTSIGAAGKIITFPNPSSLARSYIHNLRNDTEHNLTISVGTGTTFTLVSHTAQFVEFTPALVRKAGAVY